MDEIARGVAAQSVAARIASSRWMAMISAVSAESPRYCNGGAFEGDAAAAPGAREVTEAAELAAIAALRMIDDEVTAVPSTTAAPRRAKIDTACSVDASDVAGPLES